MAIPAVTRAFLNFSLASSCSSGSRRVPGRRLYSPLLISAWTSVYLPILFSKAAGLAAPTLCAVVSILKSAFSASLNCAPDIFVGSPDLMP